MRSLLSAVLLLSAPSVAAPLQTGVVSRTLLGQAPGAAASPAPGEAPRADPTPAASDSPVRADDEEEDEEGGAQTPTTAVPSATPAASPGAPPAASDAATQGATPVMARRLPPEQVARQQQLVSGAPLYNPNVAVHIVQKKQLSDAGKSELAIYPVAPQVNGKFVQHHGSALSYTYHVNENFGLQATGQYNWYNEEAKFNQALVERFDRLPLTASSLLLEWAGTAGVEVSPFYGKFAFYQNSLAHFSVVINGGAGIGQTRAQIRPQTSWEGAPIPPSYGDTGLRFIGSVGAGFRVQIGDRFAFRLEARDLVYSAQVSSVNGCNQADLTLLEQFTDNVNHGPLSQAGARGSCDVEKFDGTVPGTNYPNDSDLGLALDRIRSPSSDVLNNIGFYTGFSFLF